MKILDKIKSKINVPKIGILLGGVLIGWLLFGSSTKTTQVPPKDHALEDHKPGTVWTCSMHPQIRDDGPGKCPICGMDLIEVETDDSFEGVGQYTVRLSDAAMKIAEVSTITVNRNTPHKQVYLPGKIRADERKISELTSRFPGRIEKLNVNFTGQSVRRGQVLAKIYSPELITAQKELLESIKYKESNPRYYEASRKKLELWDLTAAQINQIEQGGEIIYYFDVLSPVTGTVTMRHVSLGDYIKEGSQLFEVIDLSHVWVVFDAYESDLPWINLNDEINFTVKSIPGENFTGRVSFIDPVINQNTRVAGVRVELPNRNNLLKPQMLASGILKSTLEGEDKKLLAPKSAVLWTGKRSIVYVRTDDKDNLFQYREVELGADAGDHYVIKNGLTEGEVIVSNGVFKIDASAQLQGKTSMMNPEGEKIGTPHDHGEKQGHVTPKVEVQSEQEVVQMSEIKIDPEFKKQLKGVFAEYLKLVDALVDSNAENAKVAAKGLRTSLEKVEMSRLKGDDHMKWMELVGPIGNSVIEIMESGDLETQRHSFSVLSDMLYQSIKYFEINGLSAYYQFCPMAMNNKGAYWMSTNSEIRNPYFGADMLTCGATEEELN